MKKYIVSILSLILIVLIVTGCEAKKVEEVTDAEKVSLEYTVSKDNKFVYADYEKVMDVLKSDGIIYFGYPEKDFCKSIVEILTDITKKNTVTIYYFNPKQLADKKTDKYQQLLEQLKQDELIVPAVYFVKDGSIIDKEISLSKKIEHEYLTKQEVRKLKKLYQEKIANYLSRYEQS